MSLCMTVEARELAVYHSGWLFVRSALIGFRSRKHGFCRNRKLLPQS
jgi:hypothetical protein